MMRVTSSSTLARIHLDMFVCTIDRSVADKFTVLSTYSTHDWSDIDVDIPKGGARW